MGPLLLSIYINDLPSVWPQIKMQMRANDTVFYVHAKTKQQTARKRTAAMDTIADLLD
jgi:hypothetical protein